MTSSQPGNASLISALACCLMAEAEDAVPQVVFSLGVCSLDGGREDAREVIGEYWDGGAEGGTLGMSPASCLAAPIQLLMLMAASRDDGRELTGESETTGREQAP